MCKHKNTTVTNSAKPGAKRKGYEIVTEDYPVFAQRSRKCLDCGINIATVEVLRDQMDDLYGMQAKVNYFINRYIEQSTRESV